MFLVGLLFAAACTAPVVGNDASLLCIPGQSVTCACPGGTPGAQACRDDGRGYGACACGTDAGGMDANDVTDDTAIRIDSQDIPGDTAIALDSLDAPLSEDAAPASDVVDAAPGDATGSDTPPDGAVACTGCYLGVACVTTTSADQCGLNSACVRCPGPVDAQCAVATCSSGRCGTANLPDGTTCSAGVCVSGGCVPCGMAGQPCCRGALACAPADILCDVARNLCAPCGLSGAPACPVGMALTYRPAGCGYDVTTTAGTRSNLLGVDTTFGASPDPRNIHLTWPADPSTGVAVLWATDLDTLAAVVEYGTSPTTLDHTQHGHVSTGGSSTNAVHVHEVHLCGLLPNTTYYYHAGGSGHFSPTYHFKTAPMPGDTTADVNFAISGDSRADAIDPSNFPRDWHAIQAQIATASGAASPDFQIFTGDAIAIGTDQPSWDQWFGAAPNAFANMPWVLLNADHEGLAVNFLLQIAQPQAHGELYFSFDYGPIHFVVLNDSPPSADGLAAITGAYASWLELDLAAVNRVRTPWVIVTHHKGPYTTSTHSDDPDVLLIRNTWPPIYDRHHVDLVINGHDHSLHVTRPLIAGAVAPTG
ncbi:MAG: metallophosphoesterase family protein, partial [Deltaproteobacteria bacterium]